MAVTRAARFSGDGARRLYLHMGGKIGVLVELQRRARGAAHVRRRRRRCVRELAMQIAAASPAYATREEVPADVIEKEKAVYRGQMENSGKPANVIEKIIEGKLGSFYSRSCSPSRPSIRDPEDDRGAGHRRGGEGASAARSRCRASRGSRSAKASRRLHRRLQAAAAGCGPDSASGL